ncbi:MAG: PHB depolymerase family esterase [Gordonia sp. (in: high G+C Gram-positive bacteria)]|uniref:alpha/beta hydrolase family protein n=1 Tax=Gordonia sp. (in: high G+C Gram-positive bacteria) TaxID=84139 RepID=UPI0039E5F65C
MRRLLLILLVLPLTVVGCAMPHHRGGTAPAPVRLAYPAAAADPAQNFGDLYLPPPSAGGGPHPLLVLFHGGGRRSRIGLAATAGLARHLSATGLAVFNAEYRRVGSGGGFPTTMTDAPAAAGFAATLTRRYREVGPETYLAGHSAGGHLAVWTAENLARPPAGVLSVAGPLSLKDAADAGDRHVVDLLGGTPTRLPDRYRYADPGARRCPAVPITIVHGTNDGVVPIANAHRFRARVECPGARIRLVEVPGGDHLALISPGRPGFTTMTATVTALTRSRR